MKRRAPIALDPQLVVADRDGKLFEIPDLLMLGRSGGTAVRIHPEEFVPLPEGALLFHLPGRRPTGWDPRTGRPVTLTEWQGTPVVAAATFLPPAYTHLFLSAWQREADAAPLPLYAYTAVGWRDGGFVAPTVRIDPDQRQEVALFDADEIERRATDLLEKHPNNRLVDHLVKNCALTYCCPAARNYVLGRWEAPMPTSPACNADCVGCISYQPEQKIPVTQPRLTFQPTVEEIEEMAVAHLETAERAIVSFGQGCEGEPLLRVEVLEAAIRRIRARTSRGTVHINTNASRPEAVRRLVAAGLNSIRISLNSCQPAYYERYYRPRGYSLADVLASGRVVADGGGTVSFNYFIFSGFTDSEPEFAALQQAIEKAGTHVIQARNLNIDPDLYLEALGLPADQPPGFGLTRWIKRVKKSWPRLRFGYFNPPRDGGPYAAWETLRQL